MKLCLVAGLETLETSSKVKKITASKECIICHHWYFFYKELKSQPDVCNRCHDVLMMYINLNDIVIYCNRDVDCRCIINGIRKSEAVNLLQNIDLNEKGGSL